MTIQVIILVLCSFLLKIMEKAGTLFESIYASNKEKFTVSKIRVIHTKCIGLLHIEILYIQDNNYTRVCLQLLSLSVRESGAIFEAG